jgi:inner membrane protein
MMAITHAVISSSITSLILGKTDFLTLGLSIIGSQLPDLDSSKSIIGQIFFPISRYLENHFPHRSLTHSFLATAIISAIALLMGYYYFNDIYKLIALPVGHLVSCFSDTFTKQGVQLFYPNPVWAISVSNPHRRLRTGSPSEYYVLVAFSILLFINFSLINNTGGITNAISINLGLRDEIVKMYNQDANTHLFKASIKGYQQSDRATIDDEFIVINNIDKEFIVTDGERIYKTGENIIVENIELIKDKKIINKIETITFNDEDINSKLNKYSTKNNTKSNTIYITGSIVVDYPEDIELPSFINEYEYIKLSGATINLDYCPLEKAIDLLKDQFAMGEITLIMKNEL